MRGWVCVSPGRPTDDLGATGHLNAYDEVEGRVLPRKRPLILRLNVTSDNQQGQPTGTRRLGPRHPQGGARVPIALPATSQPTISVVMRPRASPGSCIPTNK